MGHIAQSLTAHPDRVACAPCAYGNESYQQAIFILLCCILMMTQVNKVTIRMPLHAQGSCAFWLGSAAGCASAAITSSMAHLALCVC